MDLDQIYEDIIQFGYDGKAKEKDVFFSAFNDGLPNSLYIDVIRWICTLLGRFHYLENCITVLSDGINSESQITFLGELSEVLKELNCPMKRFISGQMEDRLSNALDKREALRFLCSEIQAAKISACRKAKKEQASMQIELSESRTAKELKEMLISLNFGRPPDTITTHMLFGEIIKKIKQLCHPESPKEFVGDLLFSGCLTEKQWFQLEDFCKEMSQEYKIRRRLLIRRLDVTIESFLWADRLKGKADEIRSLFQRRKGELYEEPSVKISDILAASAGLAEIEKTSSGSVRRNTKCRVNKVMIGAVPDRGGRPEEQQPPPPEVPAWQKSQPQSRGGFSSGDKSGGFSRQSDQGRQNWQQGQDRQSKYDDQQRYSNQRHEGGRPGELGNYNRSGSGRQQQSSHMMGSAYNTQNYVSPTGDMRENYNPMYTSDPRNFHPQMQHAPQFGFGGFAPAGDNFSQYGSYQSQPTVDNSRQRGGGRYQRGRRGRGRY